MGGRIGVISRPSVGSNFWFTIQGEVWHAVTAADRDLTGVHALIVATTHASRDALKHQLTTCGGTCVTAANAESALEMLRPEADSQQPFDVALIDTQALDCFALAREIRSVEATKSLPLVLVSTVERGGHELRAAGIDGSLSLPVQPDLLYACVARVTGRLDVSVNPADQGQIEQDAWGSSRHVPEGHPPESAHSRAHVLVAEDNLVNREVATTMLETLRCSVDVVDDGAQAVGAVKGKHYDVVFLDCQMPNLDGYEAAGQIRQLEQQGLVGTASSTWPAEHLPMVALTAHTAPSDRTRSLESGMDDYVSKPFTLNTLDGMLGKWVGQLESTPTPAVESTPIEIDATNDDPISEASLDGVLELDRLSGGGVFERVVRSYLDMAPDTIEHLRTAVREGDAAGIARAAHDLKSASFNVGAQTLATLSTELEAVGRTGSTDGAEVLAAELDGLYLAVKAALEERLEKYPARDAVSA